MVSRKKELFDADNLFLPNQRAKAVMVLQILHDAPHRLHANFRRFPGWKHPSPSKLRTPDGSDKVYFQLIPREEKLEQNYVCRESFFCPFA